MSAEISFAVAQITKNGLLKPENLEKQYRKALQGLEGPARWALVKEVANLTLQHHEWTALSAHVLKGIIDGWSDDDYREMGVGRVEADAELFFTARLLPLADCHTENERRKESARRRIANAWGEVWEDEMKEMLPAWPAETFLRDLAVFAEKNPWQETKQYLSNQIVERIARPKTRKYKWLTSADLVAKGQQPKWKRAKRRVIQEVAADADESELAGNDNTELSGGHNNAHVTSRVIARTPEGQNLPEKPALNSTTASLQEDPAHCILFLPLSSSHG